MTTVQYPPPPAPQPTPKPTKLHGWRLAALIVAAIIAPVVALGVAFGVYTVAVPQAYNVNGAITVEQSPYSYYSTGGTCSTSLGYSDIQEGTSVVLRDAAGTTVAVTSLRAPTTDAYTCSYGFGFPAVDLSSSEFYSVEVSHRGEITHSAQDMRNGQGFALTLG